MKNGDMIRIYRKRKKLTMKELGEKVGVSEQTISRYEKSTRTPNLITLQKICNAISLPIENLSLNLPPLPTTEDLSKNPNLALDMQINIYVDDVDRIKVKMLCHMIQAFNYDIEIDKNRALIVDKVTDEIYVKISTDKFISMSRMLYNQAQGFVNGLKYEV